MSGLSELVRRVGTIQQGVANMKAKVAEEARRKNTTAIKATYSLGQVYINGIGYSCPSASKDILLRDGCSVYVLPDGCGGYVIVGGGAS